MTPDQDGLFNLTAMTGSLRYMAPCIALGKRYNELCDVYSFSMVLWSMLTLRRPFEEFEEQNEFQENVFLQKVRPHLPDHWSEPLQEMFCSGWHHEAVKRCDMSTMRRVLQHEMKNVCADTEKLVCDHQRRRSTFVYEPRSLRIRSWKSA